MGDKTGISWTDATWSPARGCSRISEGCRNCYAERIAARFSDPGQPFHGFAVRHTAPRDSLDQVGGRRAGWTRKVEFQPDQLAIPLRWKKPRRIFCSSMTDIFHESLTNEQIAAVFGVMAACPQHTFQILTKRAKRMREWFAWVVRKEPVAHARAIIWAYAFEHLRDLQHRGAFGRDVDIEERMRPADFAWPLPNVWPGVSVEDRKHGVPRIDELRRVPAAVHMLSCEPLLEDLGTLDLTDIGWLIDGCESGAEARLARPEWFASLEEQCRAAGVPYFHKQEMVDGKLVHDFPGRQEFPS